MIGALFMVMALAFGEFAFAFLAMIPNSVLGVLLVFAGLELCPLVRSLKGNEEYFVALLITGIALAVPNMAWAFGIGIAADLFIRKLKIKIRIFHSQEGMKDLIVVFLGVLGVVVNAFTVEIFAVGSDDLLAICGAYEIDELRSRFLARRSPFRLQQRMIGVH